MNLVRQSRKEWYMLLASIRTKALEAYGNSLHEQYYWVHPGTGHNEGKELLRRTRLGALPEIQEAATSGVPDGTPGRLSPKKTRSS